MKNIVTLLSGMWTGKIPCIILVRKGAEIPHVPVAQSTSEIDWSKIYKVRF